MLNYCSCLCCHLLSALFLSLFCNSTCTCSIFVNFNILWDSLHLSLAVFFCFFIIEVFEYLSNPISGLLFFSFIYLIICLFILDYLINYWLFLGNEKQRSINYGREQGHVDIHCLRNRLIQLIMCFRREFRTKVLIIIKMCSRWVRGVWYWLVIKRLWARFSL